MPKYRFVNESDHFAKAYGLSEDACSESSFVIEGSSDEGIVKLDVSIDPFKDFLRVLYPMYVSTLIVLQTTITKN